MREASGFLSMLTEYNFVFSMCFLHKSLGLAKILFKSLQSVKENVFSAKERLERFNLTITELRTDASFDNFMRETIESIASLPPTEPKPKRKSLETSSSRIDRSIRRQYFKICDNLGQHINMRFGSYP